MQEENLLTRTIPRSNGNLAKPQAQPLAVQLFAPENIIIFTHTHRDTLTHTQQQGAVSNLLSSYI